MAPNEATQNDAIVRLLRYFQWTWVGLLVSNDESGEEFVQSLKSMFSWNGICVAFTAEMPLFSLKGFARFVIYTTLKRGLTSLLLKSKANVVVVYGDANYMKNFQVVLRLSVGKESVWKIWITTSRWEMTSKSIFGQYHQHGSLVLVTQKNNMPGFQNFLKTYQPSLHGNNAFMNNFWAAAFKCKIPSSYMNTEKSKHSQNCTGKEMLETLSRSIFEMSVSDQSYSIYNGIYTLAYTLHAVHSARQGTLAEIPRLRIQTMQSWEVKITLYMRYVIRDSM